MTTTVRDTTVCYYDSTMGAGDLSGTADTLIAILDACLVNGFGAVTASSLVVTSGIATITVNAGHGMTNPGALTAVDVGVVVAVSGVTGALTALNGTWRATVTSTTVLTWSCGAIADGTAAGTISVKHAPAGWTKAFTGTHLAAYKSANIAATGCYLRVDDSPAQYPTLIMYEAMTGISTGTGLAPTTGSLYFAKSSAASGTVRAWRLYADSRAFYLFVNADGSTWPAAMMFGDIVSYRSPDAYACLLLAHAAGNTTSHIYLADGTTTGAWLSRSYSGLGAAVASGRYSHRKCQYLGAGGMVSPNPVDNAMLSWPVECWEGSTLARGLMPGLFCPVHDAGGADGFIFAEATAALLHQQTGSASYRAFMAVTGAWR
jgi:hypothetical protein